MSTSAGSAAPAVKLGTSQERPHLFVYVSCSIKKGPLDDRCADFFFDDVHEKQITGPVASADLTLLNPAKSHCRRNDFYANYGCDLHMIEISDVMIVDAREEKGIGTGAELMYAHQRGMPTISVCPPESNYRRSFVANVCGEDLYDWVHPFVFGLSSLIVEDFEAAGEALEMFATGRLSLKVGRSPRAAIEHYLRQREAWTRS